MNIPLIRLHKITHGFDNDHFLGPKVNCTFNSAWEALRAVAGLRVVSNSHIGAFRSHETENIYRWETLCSSFWGQDEPTVLWNCRDGRPPGPHPENFKYFCTTHAVSLVSALNKLAGWLVPNVLYTFWVVRTPPHDIHCLQSTTNICWLHSQWYITCYLLRRNNLSSKWLRLVLITIPECFDSVCFKLLWEI